MILDYKMEKELMHKIGKKILDLSKGGRKDAQFSNDIGGAHVQFTYSPNINNFFSGHTGSTHFQGYVFGDYLIRIDVDGSSYDLNLAGYTD